MEELIGLAEAAGVHVIWRDLGRRRGEYRASGRLITINPRMSLALQRSTLAHELGHHRYGDTWTDDRDLIARRERRANAYAATLLITPEQYRRAELLVGSHPGALARELGVARHLVDAWMTTAHTHRRTA